MSMQQATGAPATDWASVFAHASVLADELAGSKSAKAKATKIGQFLSPLVGRQVAVLVKGRTGRVTLRCSTARAKTKLYYFELRWDDGAPSADTPPVAPATPTLPVLGAVPALERPRQPAPAALDPAQRPGGNAEAWG